MTVGGTVSSMSSDAQIARQWAEGFIKHAGSAQIVDADELTAARRILATTTPPTMADMTEDEREACQWMQGRDESGDLLVIACVRWEHCDVIYRDGVTTTAMHDQITPLPDLPRLEWPAGEPAEDTPEPEQPRPEDVKPDPQPGEAWLIEYEGQRYEAVYWYSPIYAHWAFVENREGLKTVESPEATPVSRLLEGGNHESR